MKDDRDEYWPEENGGAILSRRNLLELVGMSVAGAAIPSVAVFSQPILRGDLTEQDVSPVMDKLSKYMSEASGRACPKR
jgi:hypothetical protein